MGPMGFMDWWNSDSDGRGVAQPDIISKMAVYEKKRAYIESMRGFSDSGIGGRESLD